jgi:hypothetical protein
MIDHAHAGYDYDSGNGEGNWENKKEKVDRQRRSKPAQASWFDREGLVAVITIILESSNQSHFNSSSWKKNDSQCQKAMCHTPIGVTVKDEHKA